MSSPYDFFAWFYNRYWATPLLEWQQPALEKLLFSGVSAGSTILDVCCGGGHLAKQMAARGYRVIGVDSSAEMLQFARKHAPTETFILADATDFTLPEPVDAAVCTFDSVNHLLESTLLERAFRRVHTALREGGVFLFDVNTANAYGERWDQSVSEIHSDHVFILRGGFEPQKRVGTTKITMFRLNGTWSRADVEMRQRPWELSELKPLLEGAGFSDVSASDPVQDLGMTGHYGIGRVYVRARKGGSGAGRR